MKKSFIHIIKTVMAVILFAGLLMSCAAGDRIKTDKAQEFKSIKNIAVQTFSCPDPDAANDVRNIIIAYLLDTYSVIIGEKADVVISGTITLHPEQVPSSSSGRAAGRVKEISSEIMHNGKILDSISVKEAGVISSASDPLEVMAHEVAEQLSRKLSKISSANPLFIHFWFFIGCFRLSCGKPMCRHSGLSGIFTVKRKIPDKPE